MLRRPLALGSIVAFAFAATECSAAPGDCCGRPHKPSKPAATVNAPWVTPKTLTEVPGPSLISPAPADNKSAPEVKSAESRSVQLTGILLCAKCTFKETQVCANVLVVKGTGSDTIYYLDDKGAEEKYHKAVCGGTGRYVAVSGKVLKKDGKLWLKANTVEEAAR